MNTPAELRVTALRRTWADGSVALDGVDLAVRGGEFVAVLGPSGAGKSTLLRCIARLVEPTAGTVTLHGTDVTGVSGRALHRARAQIGFVFQQFNLVPSYTVLQNVLVGRLSEAPAWRWISGRFSDEDRAFARACLEDVGMAHKADAPARELSGGQQQRVAIARAFAQRPRLLLADEPTAALDPNLADTVLELLRAYGRSHSVPVVVNVHAVEQAKRFADRVVGLRAGKVVRDVPAPQLDAATLDAIYGAPEEP